MDLCRRLGIEVSLPRPDLQGSPRVVAEYVYCNESGEPVRRKVRWEPGFRGRSKSFLWEKPDGTGGWTKSKGDGNPKLLYGTERLATAGSSKRTLLVVEGEKDCETAWSLNWPAVCNPEGAAGEGQRSKWRRSYTEQLKGLPVVVVADKDTPGRLHAREVARRLSGTSARVAVMELPGESAKDLSDWVAVCRSDGLDSKAIGEKLEAELQKARPWQELAEEPVEQAPKETDDAKPRRPPQSQVLVGLAASVELFHTEDQTAFGVLPVDSHRETWAIRSAGFEQWLTQQLYAQTGQAARSAALAEAVGLLEARARFEGDQRPVALRVAESHDEVVLDLGNKSWEAVRMDAESWEVVPSPVHFRRPSSHRPLATPTRGGSVNLLRDFVNVESEEDFVLLVSWLLGALRPRGPYPILVLEGEQGTAKSTTARILRSLVDPSQSPVRSAPREEQDLLVSALNSWVLSFDNLSGLKPWLSDALCRLSTGGGFSCRRLYTDHDEVVIDAQRPLILNGIERLAHRQDLLDRALVIRHPTIPDRQRRTESELWDSFEAVRPRLLGALCSAISAALRNGPTVRLANRPRLADFAEWVVAAESALPWPAGTFLEACEQNRAEALEQSIEDDPVASAILDRLESVGEIRSSAQDLLIALGPLVPESTRRSPAWPTSPRGLAARIKRVAPGLRRLGVECQRLRLPDRNRRRLFIFTRGELLGSDEIAI